MATRPSDVRLAAFLAFLGIMLIGLSLRTVITSFSPLIRVISAEVPLDVLTLGVIAAAPTLAYALSGVIGPVVGSRIGLTPAALLVLAVMAGGHLIRALSGEPITLLLATIVTLLASGVGNVLVPPLIKQHFPERLGVVTASYVASLSLSGAFPAFIAIPMAEVIGWRASMGVWAAAAVIAMLPWAIRALMTRGRRYGGPGAPGLAVVSASRSAGAKRMTSSRVAWALVGLFSMCSFGGFAMLAWMPVILAEAALLDPAAAGSLLSLFAICGFPIAIIVPPLVARRARAIIPIIVVGMVGFLIGYSGLLLAPSVAPVLWTLALGVGSLPYPLAFTLIGLRTRTTETALRLSGFVQGVGYIVAAIGPFFVGVLHELTGGWTVPLAFLMSSVLLGVPAVLVLGSSGFVDDELLDRRVVPAD